MRNDTRQDQCGRARKNLTAVWEQNYLCRIHDIRRATERLGPGEVRRSIGMRRLPAICLDPMKFLQAFAGGLRAEFADAACAPVPEYLAALMRQFDGDLYEYSGEGRENGTSPTEPSGGVDRRGRRRTARPHGEAA